MTRAPAPTRPIENPSAERTRALTTETSKRAHESQGMGGGFAVVGYALRVPGAADADAFWDVLQQGRDAVSEVPADRWDVEEFFDPNPDAPGKIVSRRAGFIDDVAGFDAPFFGLSKRETMLIDPQQRLLLETAWQALEDAAIAPAAWRRPRPACSWVWARRTT